MVDTISQALLWGRMNNAKGDAFVSRKLIANKPINGYAHSHETLNDKLMGYSRPTHNNLRGYKV
jgi:hypothetical protein